MQQFFYNIHINKTCFILREQGFITVTERMSRVKGYKWISQQSSKMWTGITQGDVKETKHIVLKEDLYVRFVDKLLIGPQFRH